MAENAGLGSWFDVGEDPVWLASRELGTGGQIRIDNSYPGAPTGVMTPAGHVHQSGGASPKASTGSDHRPTVSVSFSPMLSRLDYEHLRELLHTQRQGLPSLWLPFPRVESWAVRGTERNTWSLAGIISGTAGVRGKHMVPKVRVRDAGGTVVAATDPTNWPASATLTIVSGVPATDTEIQIPTGPDTTELVTGDLTSYAGGSLMVTYFGLVAVEILAVSDEVADYNRLLTDVQFLESPPQKDYEADS